MFAVDELHCVEDWKTFRPMYSRLGVLRSRLPPVPYLGVTATLHPDSEVLIREAGGFDFGCLINRTSIDRPEVAIHVLFAEGVLKAFEDLRRFFPVAGEGQRPICELYQLPKMVFYFNTVLEVMAFVRKVSLEWFSEWQYPLIATKWIQPYFANMSEFDKQRISCEFEKPDTPFADGQSSTVRILAATEGYGLGADNPDIQTVVNFRIPKTLNSLTQRMGRAMRNGHEGGRFFLVADPYTSIQPLSDQSTRPSKSSRVRSSQRQMCMSGSDSDIIVREPKSKRVAQDALRRQKLPKDLVDFINSPSCFRQTLLQIYNEPTPLPSRPRECCSLCNQGLIPPFRPLPDTDHGSAFFDMMEGKLKEWRTQEARSLFPTSDHIPETILLADSLLDRLAHLNPHLVVADPGSLKRVLDASHYGEPYEDALISVFKSAVACGASEPAKYIMQARADKVAKRANRALNDVPVSSQSPFIDNRQRYHDWLIRKGRHDMISKAAGEGKKKRPGKASRPQDSSIGIQTPPSTQNTSFELSQEAIGIEMTSGFHSQDPDCAGISSGLRQVAAGPSSTHGRQILHDIDPNSRR